MVLFLTEDIPYVTHRSIPPTPEVHLGYLVVFWTMINKATKNTFLCGQNFSAVLGEHPGM
jgi:hypothetical protein